MKVFRYPGGKAKASALSQIKAVFPSRFQEYREPFVGGGGVFWTLPRSMRRWINDRNRPLIAVYEALKNRPAEFAAMCAAIEPAEPGEPMVVKPSGIQYPKRLVEKFYELLNDDNADPALRYFFLNRCGWNGRVRLDSAWRHRTYFSNPKGWSPKLSRTLKDAAVIVAAARITSTDYEALFDEPGDEVLIFADPPYVKDTTLSNSGKLYEFGFGMEDHRRLRDCVLRCKHKVVLTYDDHPLIRHLYRDFYLQEASWTYSGRSDRAEGHELIITNYATNSLVGIESAAPTRMEVKPNAVSPCRSNESLLLSSLESAA